MRVPPDARLPAVHVRRALRRRPRHPAMPACRLPLLFVLLGLALIPAAGCGGIGEPFEPFERHAKTCWIRLENASPYGVTHFDTLVDGPIELNPTIEPGQTALIPMHFYDAADPYWWSNEGLILVYTIERPGLRWSFIVTATPCHTETVTVRGEPGPEPF